MEAWPPTLRRAAATMRHLVTQSLESGPLLTADDYFHRQPEGRSELIRGKVVPLSPAGGRHGSVAARIARYLGAFVEQHDLGDVSTCDTGYVLERAPDTVRAPDVGFVAKSRIPASGIPVKFWPLAPDLAVEVISPDDAWSHVEAKSRQWLAAGTQEVWLVDPGLRELHLHRAGAPPLRLCDGDELTSRLLPGLQLDVTALLGPRA